MGSKSKSSSGGGEKQRYANPLERAGNPFERQGNVVVNTGVVNPNRNTQRYDNPFERQTNQQADETLINAAAEKLQRSNPQGNFNTGAGSDIRNELVRMRNQNYQRSNPEELKLANATNLGQTNVGSNQYFTAQQPTFAEVRGDVGTRLGQDAQNYGTGIMGAAMSAATGIPGLGFLLNQFNQNTSPDGYRFIEEEEQLMNNQGFSTGDFDFPVSNMGEFGKGSSVADILANQPGGTGFDILANQPGGTGFDISKILQEKVYEDKIVRDNRRNDEGGGSGSGSGSGQDVFTENQLLLIANFISAGYSREEAEAKARSYNFAFGGSVAPQSGPMSEGVGTLYRMK